MKDYKNIPMPTEQEKERSIQWILDNGLPQKESFGESLSELWHSIGVRGLFFGVEDSSLLALFITVLTVGYTIPFCAKYPTQSEVMLFAVSPFLYSSMFVLNIWKEYLAGMYEQKMTCRFSAYQVNALRMLVFGGLSLVVSVILSAGMCFSLQLEHSFFRLFSISASSLFLFASAQIVTEWKLRVPVCHFLVPALWLLLNGLLLQLGFSSIHLLAHIPTVVFGIITAGAATFYWNTLKTYYYSNKEGAICYAVN
ncbi:MAG: hypothetical protein MJ077_09965 [Oscillospiraceae bacterium]|nr:hypothetical protein [Oscillospiraceae bacterium]